MDLRDTILAEATQLFSTKGFNKTTITDIVKASKTSKGGLYHHFSSKEEIVETILNNYLGDFDAYMDRLYEKYDQNLFGVFNGIFEAINQYKKDQMYRWPELIKMISFPGNENILSRMSQTFEVNTCAFIEEILNKGNGDYWHIDNAKHIAGLWTREILRIYATGSVLLYDWTDENYNDIVSLLDFNENLINTLLKSDQISIKKEVLEFLNMAKEQMAKMNLKAQI